MYKEIRRKDRATDNEAALALLNDGEYGVLSTVDQDNQPYGTPVNYAVVDNSIFIHSATEGCKLENIRSNSNVSFCVVGKTELLPEQFSTRYFAPSSPPVSSSAAAAKISLPLRLVLRARLIIAQASAANRPLQSRAPRP